VNDSDFKNIQKCLESSVYSFARTRSVKCLAPISYRRGAADASEQRLLHTMRTGAMRGGGSQLPSPFRQFKPI
jgi:hypothetical protein